MAHIDLNNPLPGISGLLAYRPETARPLMQLAEVLLRGPSTLTAGERELIAAYVSDRNECHYCTSSHGAAARQLLNGEAHLVDDVREDLCSAPVSDKLRALLTIARQVQQSGRLVAEEEIAEAKRHGATDIEIHDTVLIAAAFCMYNRYVDGLATWAPAESAAYVEVGQRLAEQGYVRDR